MVKSNPTHPGLSVLDSLDAVGWTIPEFANRLEIDEDEVSGLLDGKCGISPRVALALERLEWGTAEFWMRRQVYYDLAQERLGADLGLPHMPTSEESIGNAQPEESLADATAYYRPKLGTFILTDYIDEAMYRAVYDKMDDGTYCGTIPPCIGVIAFGQTKRECSDELQATLEGWLLMNLKLGDPIPPINGVDLNVELKREPVDAV